MLNCIRGEHYTILLYGLAEKIKEERPHLAKKKIFSANNTLNAIHQKTIHVEQGYHRQMKTSI